MADFFSHNLHRFRVRAGLTQQQLAEKMYVDRSTVARWENGYRLPDLVLMQQLAVCLGVNIGELFEDNTCAQEKRAVILMVDDEQNILDGNLRVISEVYPEADIIGVTKPSEAIRVCEHRRVDVAFLDIELGKSNGMDLCKQLIATDPKINVIFLTAYEDYSLDAWKTLACGFLVKPLVAEDVKAVMGKLRRPLPALEDEKTDVK